MMIGIDPSEMRAQRHAMVASQLRTNAVSDTRVVAAMATVPREAFLPGDAAKMAYRDTAIPLGRGRAANAPIATGRLLTAATLDSVDRVLLIGAAGGYAAAVLAQLAAHIVAVESDGALAEFARAALAGMPTVEVVQGELTEGWVAGAPYDVLIVDGAVEALPPMLIEQVRPGGRVVTGLIERGVTRLAAGRRTAGGFGLASFVDTECVLLPGFAPPQAFRF
ncbi:MAG: protein-L-isoaspartate O-methyltransferase [Sphingomonas bacterium]|uniref:protein-L-isoaspartate O-methyltransferase family protein n=1 Tax=Sphingomonas bacterium TaxID=1895847 RepID=UPI00262170C8|nr:protein-L-isoaspartate O-methyltransferase [Sphingomonas bacterium]MDB5696694.1 protein-L-isoaspartate O-methyltransferase [Sphingomonas bacterium]